jgi:hypothetical protein
MTRLIDFRFAAVSTFGQLALHDCWERLYLPPIDVVIEYPSASSLLLLLPGAFKVPPSSSVWAASKSAVHDRRGVFESFPDPKRLLLSSGDFCRFDVEGMIFVRPDRKFEREEAGEGELGVVPFDWFGSRENGIIVSRSRCYSGN